MTTNTTESTLLETTTKAEEAVAAASTRLDQAISASRQADEHLVLAALQLLCLSVQKDNPTAVAIELEWSDQGDFLSVCQLVDVVGEPVSWEDEDTLAWNFEGHTERHWATFMTADDRGSRFRLDIVDTLAALGSGPQPSCHDMVDRIDHVLARAEEIDAAWEVATVAEGDPVSKVWQADDDDRRDLALDAIEVLRSIRACCGVDEGAIPNG